MKRVFPWIILAVIAYAINDFFVGIPLSTNLIMWSSGGFGLSLSVALVGGAEILLLIELLLAASSLQWATNANHLLSALVWAASIGLFVGVLSFRTATFALIILSMTIDVIAGIWITQRLAPRYVAVDRSLPGNPGTRRFVSED